MTQAHQMRYPDTNSNVTTAGERDVLDAIKAYWAEHQFAPSVRDLCELTDINSTGYVYRILLALRAEGLVDFQPNMARTIRVVNA